MRVFLFTSLHECDELFNANITSIYMFVSSNLNEAKNGEHREVAIQNFMYKKKERKSVERVVKGINA